MKRAGRFVLPALAASAILAASSVWIASSFPDGLEWVAEKLGFAHRAAGPALKAPLPDYSVPFWRESPLAGILAALAGVALTYALALALARLLARHRRVP